MRTWLKTHKRLRKIAAETGESIIQVLDRLSGQERQQVQQKEQEEEQQQATGITREE